MKPSIVIRQGARFLPYWKGGETTTFVIPVPIGTFKDLAGAEIMEQVILERSAAGILDEDIAQE